MQEFSIYLGGAFFLGLLHALEPGHGKTIAAAYLIGSKGRARDAVLLGGVTTTVHVGSVLLFGLLAVAASSYYLPVALEGYLQAASGLLVVGVGIWMFLRRDHHGNRHPHSRSGIVSLGISGGIVPCPAAVTMLLLAISLGRVAEGLLVVVAFSLGLALALVLLGILATRASDLLLKRWHSGNASRLVPKVSALVVIFLGLVLIHRTWNPGWL